MAIRKSSEDFIFSEAIFVTEPKLDVGLIRHIKINFFLTTKDMFLWHFPGDDSGRLERASPARGRCCVTTETTRAITRHFFREETLMLHTCLTPRLLLHMTPITWQVLITCPVTQITWRHSSFLVMCKFLTRTRRMLFIHQEFRGTLGWPRVKLVGTRRSITLRAPRMNSHKEENS